jgi:hypothetical protein
MSFLLDPPLLVAHGAAIERCVGEQWARAAEAAVLGTFIGVSAGLYRNASWPPRLWPASWAESGRDWMLNSGVFAFEHERPSSSVHWLAVGLFATYPLWLRLGRGWARRRSSARSRS